MTNVTTHYEQLLAGYYTWMFGCFEKAVAEQQTYFDHWGITPKGSKNALDLGCGSGFQSMALADLGFRVTAIDLSQSLLTELAEHKGERAILQMQGDMRDVLHLVDHPFEVIVCMGDTLPHLENQNEVIDLFTAIRHLLTPDGVFVLSFRDLSVELQHLDRFIPVRSDANTIMTCFLEYEAEKVRVHDLIYTRQGEQWTMRKSSYWKLRLNHTWVAAQLQRIGFVIDIEQMDGGMWFLVARVKASLNDLDSH